MSPGSTLLKITYRAGAVAAPLVVAAAFAVGTLVGALALVEWPPAAQWVGITDGFLERFARNHIIQLQMLMFLVGVFYLLVRVPFVRRTRHEARDAIADLIGDKPMGVDEDPSTKAPARAKKHVGAHQRPERIEALVARAEAAENASLAPLSFVVWVLPILGFLGTVIGVSNSMGPLEALAKGESAAKVAPELLRHLRFPFDATFMGLVLLLPMMVCFTVLAARARRNIAELRVGALVTGGAPAGATES
jgi:hypothetical protein